MKVLVTGRRGQVASSLAERASRHPNVELVFASRPEVDLADKASISAAVHSHRPDIIVNAAAYTAVDRAEEEPELAHRVNARAPAILAEEAASLGIRLIHLSTDYVFDGRSTKSYREEDAVAPLGVYGRSKLAGEEAVRAIGGDYLIVRTAWVYSPFGKNFVNTMLALASQHRTLRVVTDQVGSPTSAFDIADALFGAIKVTHSHSDAAMAGTYHFAGQGEASWADLARHLFAVSREAGGPWAEVVSISTEEWSTAAPRPKNSRLNSARFADVFGIVAPAWEDSVAVVASRLLSASGRR